MELYNFIDKMPGAFSKNVKQILVSYMMKEEFRIDYDRIRRIVESAVESIEIAGMSSDEIEQRKNQPEKSFFGIGKTY